MKKIKKYYEIKPKDYLFYQEASKRSTFKIFVDSDIKDVRKTFIEEGYTASFVEEKGGDEAINQRLNKIQKRLTYKPVIFITRNREHFEKFHREYITFIAHEDDSGEKTAHRVIGRLQYNGAEYYSRRRGDIIILEKPWTKTR